MIPHCSLGAVPCPASTPVFLKAAVASCTVVTYNFNPVVQQRPRREEVFALERWRELKRRTALGHQNGVAVYSERRGSTPSIIYTDQPVPADCLTPLVAFCLFRLYSLDSGLRFFRSVLKVCLVAIPLDCFLLYWIILLMDLKWGAKLVALCG